LQTLRVRFFRLTGPRGDYLLQSVAHVALITQHMRALEAKLPRAPRLARAAAVISSPVSGAPNGCVCKSDRGLACDGARSRSRGWRRGGGGRAAQTPGSERLREAVGWPRANRADLRTRSSGAASRGQRAPLADVCQAHASDPCALQWRQTAARPPEQEGGRRARTWEAWRLVRARCRHNPSRRLARDLRTRRPRPPHRPSGVPLSTQSKCAFITAQTGANANGCAEMTPRESTDAFSAPLSTVGAHPRRSPSS